MKFRFMSLYFTVLIVLFFALSSCSKPAPSSTTSPVTHKEAARALFLQLGGKSVAEASAESMLSAVLASNPKLVEHKEIVRTWCRKAFLDGTFESEISDLYMKHFSEQEIRDLITFYQTPLGQKALQAMPNIARQAPMVGIKYVQTHGQELKEMIMASTSKKQPGPSPKK